MFGSIILPLLLYVTHSGFLFGWAKPVPYNPYNLRNRRLGEFCVSVAGVLTNFLIAIAFAIFIRFAVVLNLSESAILLVGYIILLNITLGVFNLVPIPPLDGSKILFTLVPYRYEHYLRTMEQYGFFLVVIFIVFLGPVISKIVYYLFNLLV
jgi:Zn-dependent protease